MSVRIIFRGLILFRFPGGLEKPTRIVAHLINKREVPRPGKARGRHEHYHDGQFQVLTGDPNEDMAPELLRDGENVDITVVGGAEEVAIEPSFLAHVPQLSDVIDKGIGNVHGLKPNAALEKKNREDLIQNTITINRGRIRVRNVVTWDQGGFPLLQATGQLGLDPASHARLNFVGSTVSGYLASEFVVDIPDATGVELALTKARESRDRFVASNQEEEAKEKKRQNKLKGAHKAKPDPNHRVREGSVEILITNYEHQGRAAVPWGLDFQWLFEALGYASVDLTNAGFADFVAAASRYDRALFKSEVELLLKSRNGVTDPDNQDPERETFTLGLPFPYIPSPDALVSVRRVGTDEESRPICIGAFQGGGS